jgi:hypothetical protein
VSENIDLNDDVTISAQVISIADFSIKRAAQKKYTDCQHLKLTRDDELQIVGCDDCGKKIGNYAALSMLIARWEKLQRSIESKNRKAVDALNKTIVLRAAQKVESAWRSQKMVPTCPHCIEAIFPNDGFGSTAVNKEVALRRRAIKNNSATP